MVVVMSVLPERHEDFTEEARICGRCQARWWTSEGSCPTCAEFERARAMARLANALSEEERQVVACLLDDVLEHPERMAGVLEPELRGAAMRLRERVEEVL